MPEVMASERFRASHVAFDGMTRTLLGMWQAHKHEPKPERLEKLYDKFRTNDWFAVVNERYDGIPALARARLRHVGHGPRLRRAGPRKGANVSQVPKALSGSLSSLTCPQTLKRVFV